MGAKDVFNAKADFSGITNEDINIGLVSICSLQTKIYLHIIIYLWANIKYADQIILAAYHNK